MVKRLYFLINPQKGLVVTFKTLIIFSCKWNFLILTTVLSAYNLPSHPPFLVKRKCQVLGRIWKPVILEDWLH